MGLIVMVLPLMLTCVLSVILMVRVSPAPLLIMMVPEPAMMFSSKVSTRFAPTATPKASSEGLVVVNWGAVVSMVTVFVSTGELPASAVKV